MTTTAPLDESPCRSLDDLYCWLSNQQTRTDSLSNETIHLASTTNNPFSSNSIRIPSTQQINTSTKRFTKLKTTPSSRKLTVSSYDWFIWRELPASTESPIELSSNLSSHSSELDIDESRVHLPNPLEESQINTPTAKSIKYPIFAMNVPSPTTMSFEIFTNDQRETIYDSKSLISQLKNLPYKPQASSIHAITTPPLSFHRPTSPKREQDGRPKVDASRDSRHLNTALAVTILTVTVAGIIVLACATHRWLREKGFANTGETTKGVVLSDGARSECVKIVSSCDVTSKEVPSELDSLLRRANIVQQQLKGAAIVHKQRKTDMNEWYV